MAVHYIGIRHHGPGSAMRVKNQLAALKPDCILIEGPPDGQDVLGILSSPEFIPPVALMIYVPDQPNTAVFYPFTGFSPEWQGLHYATENMIPAIWMDLPCYHSFALRANAAQYVDVLEADGSSHEKDAGTRSKHDLKAQIKIERSDPLAKLGIAAGFPSDTGEHWWELYAENPAEKSILTDTINEAFDELRADALRPLDPEERLREAWMRRTIRQKQKEGFENIAVICGAWHVPALKMEIKAKEDEDLLKKLPKVKTTAAWIPWTNSRLSYKSGYGAGVYSPGFYEHIWDYPDDDGKRWLSKIATSLRKKNMDISSAQVIDASKLATHLAVLRGYPRVSLQELNEACIAVYAHGDPLMMSLINEELLIGHKMGSVPSNAPKVPLLADIESEQKKWRLKPEAGDKTILLDLREETDLGKSIFLHRLTLIDIDWGEKYHVRSKGTFKEQWQLQWRPELQIKIIEKAPYGNTIEEACQNYIRQKINDAQLEELGNFLKSSLPAALPSLTDDLILAINNNSANNQDLLAIMGIVPQLVQIIRYGNVRKTDATRLHEVIEAMLTRVCIGLPTICININEEVSVQVTDKIMHIDHAINLLKDDEDKTNWLAALIAISNDDHTQPYINGAVTRLLIDHQCLRDVMAENKLHANLSKSVPPTKVAMWLEGFLRGSGMIILLDNFLFQLLYDWVNDLEPLEFQEILPLLRRSFAKLMPAERKKIGAKIKSYTTKTYHETSQEMNPHQEDKTSGIAGLDILIRMFGFNSNDIEH